MLVSALLFLMDIKRIIGAVSLWALLLPSCSSADDPQPKNTPPWSSYGTPVRTSMLVFEPGQVPFDGYGTHASAAIQPRLWLLNEREELQVDLLRLFNPQISKLRFGYEAQLFRLSDQQAYLISRRTQVNPHLGAGGYPDYSGTLTIFDPKTYRISKQLNFDSYDGQEFATWVFALEPSKLYTHYKESKQTFEVDAFTGQRGAEVSALKGLAFKSVYKHNREMILNLGYELRSWSEGAAQATVLDLGGTLQSVIAWQGDLVICNVDHGGAKVAIYSLSERILLVPLLPLGMRPTCAYYDRAGALYFAGELSRRNMIYRADVSRLIGAAEATGAITQEKLAYASMDLTAFVAGVHSLYVSPDNRRLYALYTYGIPVYSEARLAIYDLDTKDAKYPLVPRRLHSVDKIYRPSLWEVMQH